MLGFILLTLGFSLGFIVLTQILLRFVRFWSRGEKDYMQKINLQSAAFVGMILTALVFIIGFAMSLDFHNRVASEQLFKDCVRIENGYCIVEMRNE